MSARRPRQGLVTTTVMLVLVPLLIATATPAGAQDERLDAAWPSGARVVSISTDAAGFTIVSERADANHTDRITYAFSLARASLTTTFDGTRPENVTGLRSRITFNSLIEYEDADGDGRLSFTDELVKQARFEDMGRTFPLVRYEGERDGVHTIYVRYKIPEPTAGTVEIFFTITERGGNDTAIRQRPTDLSYRVVVDGFYYLHPDNSSLALDARINPAPELGPDSVVTAQEPFRIVERWNRTAVADRAESNVSVTLQRYSGPSPDQALVAFSYPAAAHIEHANTIHIERHLPPEEGPPIFFPIGEKIIGEWRIFSVGLLLAVIAIGGATYPRLRRRW